MSIPVVYNNERYFIVDKNTLMMYNVLYCGVVFISGRRYRKYMSFDKNFLMEY